MGLGFQIHDDVLGIFGLESETGKPADDDLRRRKQSLPVLLLRERATPAVIAELDAAYASETVADDAVDRLITG